MDHDWLSYLLDTGNYQIDEAIEEHAQEGTGKGAGFSCRCFLGWSGAGKNAQPQKHQLGPWALGVDAVEKSPLENDVRMSLKAELNRV